MNLKLLLITYHFPPMGGVGVQRVLKFLKYWPRHGIDVVIATHGHRNIGNLDVDLINLPQVQSAKVIRIGGKGLDEYLDRRKNQQPRTWSDLWLGLSSVPFIDIYQKWSREIVDDLVSLIATEQIDCIFSTSPPHSTHLVAERVKRTTGIPWIMDLRDSMTDWPLRDSGIESRVLRQVEKWYEKRFYRNANGVIFVTNAQRENAISRVPELDINKTIVATNGYDPDDFQEVPDQEVDENKFVITFTGNLQDHDISVFCEALNRSLGAQSFEGKKVCLTLCGNVDQKNRHRLGALSSHVELALTGFLPHSAALALQKKSNALLLLQTSNFRNAGSEMINAKLFEYLGSGRPIIAITPNGEQSRLVKNSGRGVACTPVDIECMVKGIQRCYEMSKCPESTESVDEREFTREFQSDIAAGFIKSLVGDLSSPR